MNFHLAHGEVVPGAQIETEGDLRVKQEKGVLGEHPAHSTELETHCVWRYTLATPGREAQA